MDLTWSQADLAFQAEVRAFLDTSLSPELRDYARRMTSVYAEPGISAAWQAILHARGWAAPAWPAAYGGCDWSVVQHYIFAREKALAGAPPLSPMGVQMCGPALIGHGTPEQKDYYLPRMLSGEDLWCQGYSEPGSGSDLASLQMRAIAEGDDFICTGSKVWITHAQYANRMFCLVRTSSESRPQNGVTFLLIDMDTPGVSVRPIISLTREHIQNEVSFDAVRVPRANVLGAVGQGWAVAKYLLEFERGGAAYGPGLQARLGRLRQAARSAPDPEFTTLSNNPGFAGKLHAAGVGVDTLEATELRVMQAASLDQSAPASSSMLKLMGTELSQVLTELALDIAGVYGAAFAPSACAPGGSVADLPGCGPMDDLVPIDAAIAPLRYFNDRAGSIYAGSSEIQRNILAKTALGL